MKTLMNKHLNSTRVALVCDTKEAQQIMTLYNSGVRNGSYEIACLIDFSLPHRSRVYEMAKRVISADKIITTRDRLDDVLHGSGIDFAVFFDGGSESDNEVTSRRYSRDIGAIEADVACAYNMGKSLADKFAGGEDKSYEFNYRWPTEHIATISEHLMKNGVTVMQGYNNDRLPSLTSDYEHRKYQIRDWNYQNIVEYDRRFHSGRLCEPLRTADIKFVLGEDYGVGKASLIINRFLKNRTTIKPFFVPYGFLLNFPHFQYPVEANDVLGFRGKVLSSIARAYYEDHSNPKPIIHYKIDGRLEDMNYGVPQNSHGRWGDFFQLFDHCKFIFVRKASGGGHRFASEVERFMHKFSVTEQQVEIVAVNHDGTEVGASVKNT